jgi:hypothetical protein
MNESAVNDNAEDFPKVAVDAHPTVVIGFKFVSTFVYWSEPALVPNILEYANAEDDVKELKYSQLEFVVCVFYHVMLDTINLTGFLGLKGLYFVL